MSFKDELKYLAAALTEMFGISEFGRRATVSIILYVELILVFLKFNGWINLSWFMILFPVIASVVLYTFLFVIGFVFIVYKHLRSGSRK